MRRAERLVSLAIALSAAVAWSGGSRAASRLELVELTGTWGIPVAKNACLTLDGLVKKCAQAGKSRRSIPLSIANDSLAAQAEIPTDEASCCGDSIVHAPFQWGGFAGPPKYASYHDLMVFGAKAAVPWVLATAREGRVFAHPRSLFLRADSQALARHVKFPSPRILRPPFLSLFPEKVFDSGSGSNFWTYHGETGRISFGGVPPVASDPRWRIAWDAPDGSHRFLSEAEVAGSGNLWRSTHEGLSDATILLEALHPLEPTRVEAIQVAGCKNPSWVVETDENYADGVRTRLWIVRSDTLIGLIIGDRDGEGAYKESWSLDRRNHRVRIEAKGKKPRFVGLKPKGP